MSEIVFYIPEFDDISTKEKGCGYMFKNKIGVFHLWYFIKEVEINGKKYKPFYTFKAYLIGEL